MKHTNTCIIGLSLAVLMSCQNDDNIDKNKSATSNTEPIEQYLNADTPDGISNLTITEIEHKNFSKSYTEEENCTFKEVSFDQTNSDFFILDPNSSLLWPGNLLISRTIQEGAPASIPIDGVNRNPVEVRVNVLSGTSSSTSGTINDPTAGKVQNELNNILNNYYDSNARFPASFELSVERIHNKQQFQLALKAGYSGPSINVSGHIGVDFSTEKTRFAVTLKQRFFTASVTPKENIIGEFGWLNKDVDPDRLAPFVTDYQDVPSDKINPSSYVESVTYGKLFTMIYESDKSALEVEAALNFAYKGAGNEINAELKAKYSSVFENSKVTVKQLGGSAESGIASSLSAMANDMNGVIEFLKTGAEVSRENPGYPIAYKVNYVKGNRAFKVIQNIKYTVRNCDLVNYDKIRVDPTDVSLHNATDHGTSGAELFGRLYVEKFDKELNKWYCTGDKIYWGYGVDHETRDYYYLNGRKREIASGKVIDFKVKTVAGERFRVVSEVDECDASCYPYTDTSDHGRREIEYEYNLDKKAWEDVDRHNPYVKSGKNDYIVGSNLQNRTWNGAWSLVQDDKVVVDFWTYILK